LKEDVLKFQISPLHLSLAHSCAAAAVERKMATIEHKIFCISEFIRSELVTVVQHTFHLHFIIEPPMRKSICLWNHQFQQTGKNPSLALLFWPPRSPDLTTWDFFLWGFIKETVYVPALPTTLDDLKIVSELQ
jgi:hypothetical protein